MPIQIRPVKREASDPARQQTEGALIILLGMIEGDLQAETDAEHRRTGADDLPQRLVEPIPLQTAHGAAGSSHAGENHPGGTAQPIRVRTDLRRQPDFHAGALHAAQIPRVVVDDDGRAHAAVPLE